MTESTTQETTQELECLGQHPEHQLRWTDSYGPERFWCTRRGCNYTEKVV